MVFVCLSSYHMHNKKLPIVLVFFSLCVFSSYAHVFMVDSLVDSVNMGVIPQSVENAPTNTATKVGISALKWRTKVRKNAGMVLKKIRKNLQKLADIKPVRTGLQYSKNYKPFNRTGTILLIVLITGSVIWLFINFIRKRY